MIKYKGYIGKVEYDNEAKLFHKEIREQLKKFKAVKL